MRRRKRRGKKADAPEASEAKSRDSFTVEISLFNLTVDVYLCPFAETKRRMERKYGIRLETADYFTCNDGIVLNLVKEWKISGHVALAVDDFFAKAERDMPMAVGVLSHECIHVATMIMENAGIPVTLENDEVIAYFQEWVLESILQKVKPRLEKSLLAKLSKNQGD